MTSYRWNKGRKDDTANASCKLTPEIHRKLIKYISEGMKIGSAAALCKVHPDTPRHWLNKGFTSNAIEPFKTFAIDYNHAINGYKLKCIRKLNELATGETIKKTKRPANFQAIEYLLTHRYPEEFNKGDGKLTRDDYVPPTQNVDRVEKAVDNILNLPMEIRNGLERRGKKIVIVDIEDDPLPEIDHGDPESHE